MRQVGGVGDRVGAVPPDGAARRAPRCGDLRDAHCRLWGGGAARHGPGLLPGHEARGALPHGLRLLGPHPIPRERGRLARGPRRARADAGVPVRRVGAHLQRHHQGVRPVRGVEPGPADLRRHDQGGHRAQRRHARVHARRRQARRGIRRGAAARGLPRLRRRRRRGLCRRDCRLLVGAPCMQPLACDIRRTRSVRRRRREKKNAQEINRVREDIPPPPGYSKKRNPAGKKKKKKKKF
mmetsp:Transcript_39761/g.127096  ORF Transcript_39761/g.127096 Transcript_39761/m.127096 type:complete len:238 (+) Transcript_39761:111-824(+)